MSTTPALAPANSIKLPDGRMLAICVYCDKQSKPVAPDHNGEPDMWLLPKHWARADYPAHFQHRDGSRGSTYTCPRCAAKLRRGAKLKQRAGVKRSVPHASNRLAQAELLQGDVA